MSEFEPTVVAFCCSNCASAAAQIADGMDRTLPGNVKIIQVPCTGRIEILHLLKPFEEGADGVYVAGCQEDSCQYISGIAKAMQRVGSVKRILEQLDLEPERIDLFHVSAARGQRFVEVAQEMVERLRPMGPVASQTANI